MDAVIIHRLDGSAKIFDVRDGAADPTSMRRFYFNRTNDVSGTSGTGVVAEGVQFSDGRVALRWVTSDQPSSTVVYDSIEDCQAIHGHGGGTTVVWVDGG
jgi:prepilin-type processing-associated H-X9-DG protein